MSWKQFLSVVMLIGAMSFSLTGCRNQCGQNYGSAPFQQPNYGQLPNYGQQVQQPYYGQPVQQPYFNQQPVQQGYTAPVFNGSTSRSPLIPPPSTGSLTIPSIARNNPYGLNQNRGLLNTNQAAPTPAANRSARFNAQNGWHGTEGAQSGSGAPFTTQPAASTILSRNSATNPLTNVPANAASVLVANAQTSANRGYGDSYVRSPNYSTTATNETQDGTRLPATDASAVRAPSQYYARATGVQLARAPQQQLPQQQQLARVPQLQLPQQQLARLPQLPIANGSQPYYSGTFGTAAAPYAVPRVAPQQYQSGLFAANTNAVVLDQGTATYDPYGDTRSADWRNRDSTSGSFQ